MKPLSFKVPLHLLNSRSKLFSMTCNKGQPEGALKWRNDCLATYTRNTATVGGQQEGGEGPLFPLSCYFKMIFIYFLGQSLCLNLTPNLCMKNLVFSNMFCICFVYFFSLLRIKYCYAYTCIDLIYSL